jgi:UPF0716 protein FxsA
MPLLVLAFIAIPIAELYVIMQVGNALGLFPTIVLLLFVSIAGAWLCKREGIRAWWRFRTALDELRVPAAEVVDGALVLFAGALMLTPGFLTDIVGLLLVLPPSRALVNRLIRARVRMSFRIGGVPLGTFTTSGSAPPRRHHVQRPDEPVDVEVVQIKRSKPSE